MAYQKKIGMTSDKETLMQMVIELQLKLKKKKEELHRTRVNLKTARTKMAKMKSTVVFQRNRILELYPN
jgi:hypothetical protein